jgi:hypothetical protein
MGALKPDQYYSQKLRVRVNSIELTQHIGHTKFGDIIHATFIDGNIGITGKTNLQVRLPAYTIIEGRMPTSRGWGDLFFNLSHAIVTNDKYRLSLSAGVKLYTSKADKKSDDGLPMPMYQQTSYGSNDINFGISWMSRGWLMATGYQHPLNQNRNQFSSEQWVGSSLSSVVKVYDTSNGLSRGDDVMFRLERNIRLSRTNFYVGILNLWRVTPDKVYNEAGLLSPVEGSTGLALNLLTGGGYQFNTRMGIRVLASIKLKERDANPDGLARNFIGQVAYLIKF